MSDDEDDRSDSSSDSEDIETTGLIATRQKRVTAGNLYATLRANLDDEELQKELLAEDEEGDAEDYEGSDKGDDDDVLDSSSDEEDAGPPKAGEQEELEGEKALKRQERVEARKKRKAHDARLKIPAWRKKKSVKLADDVKTEDGSSTAAERPRKMSERSNWLPTPADAPVRQSGRSLAVQNREIVHANLKQSAERSERQRRVMKDAAEREKTNKRMTEMSQEERLRKCERIERETARDFGRWERDEAERQRLREEALAAKRKRGLEGSFYRMWSGSVLWEGDKIKIRRLSHGSRNVDEIVLEEKKAETPSEKKDAEVTDSAAPATSPAPSPGKDAAAVQATGDGQLDAPPQPQDGSSQPPASTTSASTTTLDYLPSAPFLYIPQSTNPPQIPPHDQPPTPSQQQPTQIYHGWPPGTHQFPLESPAVATPPPPPPAPTIPLVREQAQRTLLMLENFPTLRKTPNPTPKRIPKYKQTDTTLDADPIKLLLLPQAFPLTPALTPEESKYLLTRPRKRAGNEVPLPPAPSKHRCALTSWPAKFRDPKTGLAYADMHQYKAIQRILAGGCQWSGFLGCWVGSSYGLLGRPAKGVPEGFVGVGVGGVAKEGDGVKEGVKAEAEVDG
ncbi:YL1 nuclear protein-domain-containing protein [Neohortaea acidophila]|uniref:YL1 nuclear protein-domain-containing protein n=1 Tax=Neohortaea acidophila TaxID=245834 RepID=A0A6A6PMY2_9PEZI|nr:YL1 nuclear protein-domain-containing protein [Neohortaea acidophila]KAF2481352.1 YL1 nuclear protein-domain-containing protein [Neohortaea acidophila]